MGYFDNEYRTMAGLDTFPEGDFVLPIIHGRHDGLFLYRVCDPDTGLERLSGIANTEEEAHSNVAQSHETIRQFWEEKVSWLRDGDRAPTTTRPVLSAQQEAVVYAGSHAPDRRARRGPRNVLRCGGHHYVVRTFGVRRDGQVRGFGGRVFRWVFLDDPTETVHESNDLFTQGAIPSAFRDALPDNVKWV